MRPTAVALGASLALATALLGGCGAAPQAAPATTLPPAADSVTTLPGTLRSPPSTTPGATELTVTPAVRRSLLVAGAESRHLSVADFTGLAVGRTFYAYDRQTGTYWAAAELEPSPGSRAAQVSTQDDGAYDIFNKPSGATAWHDTEVGVTGAGAVCGVVPPAAVLAAWRWAPGACQPPS